MSNTALWHEGELRTPAVHLSNRTLLRMGDSVSWNVMHITMMMSTPARLLYPRVVEPLTKIIVPFQQPDLDSPASSTSVQINHKASKEGCPCRFPKVSSRWTYSTPKHRVCKARPEAQTLAAGWYTWFHGCREEATAGALRLRVDGGR